MGMNFFDYSCCFCHLLDRPLNALCPVLSILLAAAVLMYFGFTFWGGLLAALLLVCPAMLVWGAIELWLDERSQRAAKKKI